MVNSQQAGGVVARDGPAGGHQNLNCVCELGLFGTLNSNGIPVWKLACPDGPDSNVRARASLTALETHNSYRVTPWRDTSVGPVMRYTKRRVKGRATVSVVYPTTTLPVSGVPANHVRRLRVGTSLCVSTCHGHHQAPGFRAQHSMGSLLEC